MLAKHIYIMAVLSFSDFYNALFCNGMSGTHSTLWQKTFFEVKLSPKSHLGFICDWIWVKTLCKSICMTKEALLGFTLVSFSGKLIFSAWGHWRSGVKIAIFKTLRNWNFHVTVRLEERSTLTLLSVRSHPTINTFGQPWRQRFYMKVWIIFNHK